MIIRDIVAMLAVLACFSPCLIELAPLFSTSGWEETTGTVTRSYQNRHGYSTASHANDAVEYTFKTPDGVDHTGTQKSFYYWLAFSDIANAHRVSSTIKVKYDKVAPESSRSPDVAGTFAMTHCGQGFVLGLVIFVLWSLSAMETIGGKRHGLA